MRLAKNDEYSFTRQIIELAHLYGWKVAHFRAAMNRDGSWNTPVQGDGKGFPDLILVKDAWVMAPELKMSLGEPSDEQIGWMLAFNGAGVHSEVWRPGDLDRIQFMLANGPPKRERRNSYDHNKLPEFLR